MGGLSSEGPGRFDVALNDDQFLYMVKFQIHEPKNRIVFKDAMTTIITELSDDQSRERTG